jgi:hypothetical protein
VNESNHHTCDPLCAAFCERCHTRAPAYLVKRWRTKETERLCSVCVAAEAATNEGDVEWLESLAPSPDVTADPRSVDQERHAGRGGSEDAEEGERGTRQ